MQNNDFFITVKHFLSDETNVVLCYIFPGIVTV